MLQDEREVVIPVVAESNLGTNTLVVVLKYLLRTQIILKNIAHGI